MPARVDLAPRPARANAHAPSAALIADAGPLAPAVARLWPRPHAPYLTAEPARRRLAALVADRAYGDLGAIAEALETWSLKRIVAAYVAGAPLGLVEALRKIDDAAWGRVDYKRLLTLLSDGEGAKTLRHAVRIDRDFVAIVAVLPSPLRRPRIVALLANAWAAQLAARAARRACDFDNRALARLADRIDRARTPANLFRMLIDAIGIDKLAPPPVAGTDWFVPLATTAQIESAALRFENCLKYRIPIMLRGVGAYYEVVGDEPAVVEILRDSAGSWVIGEVRGHANRDISAELESRIRAHLLAHGARPQDTQLDALALALAQAAGW